LPPLEHAPDQIAARPLLTLSVTWVRDANVADPTLATAALSPARLESLDFVQKLKLMPASTFLVPATLVGRPKNGDVMVPL
jgi:hypothetical protein